MKKRKGFIKTAPKSLENKIISNALLLKEDFSVLLPKPRDNKSEKIVKSIKKRMESVWKNKDNIQKLEKFSRKKGVEGALAATLIIANQKEAPYLAHARIGNKTVAYVIRGKADAEKLISIQHFDDPVMRLIGYKDIAFKKKIAFYSWNGNFSCSHASSDLPDDFIDFIMRHLNLSRKDDKIVCHHLLKNSGNEKLIIKIKNMEIDLCRDCLKEKNTFMEISRYFIHPFLEKEVTIDIESPLREHGVELHFIDDYIQGKISDVSFFKKNMERWKEQLSEKSIFLIYWDGKIYSDGEKFLASINANDAEKSALRILFSMLKEPLFIDNPSPNAILKLYWKNLGKEILKKLADDEQLALMIFHPDEPPVRQIKDISEIMEKQNIISKYPVIEDASPVMKFVDELTRIYILHGKDKLVKKLSVPPQETKMRSIAYAFLLAIGKGEDKKWQYRKEEIEFGEYLKKYVENLLKAKPEDYINRLKDLLAAAGAD